VEGKEGRIGQLVEKGLEFSYFGVIAVCPFEVGGVDTEEV
jgi:hypothetical protein